MEIREQDRLRHLSSEAEAVVWPPEVGRVMHYNCGYKSTAWEGEVVCVVDDQIAIVRVPMPSGMFLDVVRVGLVKAKQTPEHGFPFRYGPLPEGMR